MAEPLRSAARGADRRREYSAFIVATSLALGIVAAAAMAAFDWATASQSSPLLIPAACVLLICGMWQSGLLLGHWRRRSLQPVRGTYCCVQFWQSLLSGAAVLYLLALCIGPISGLGWAWLAAVAVWQHLLLLPLAASHYVTENWRRWMETHRPGRLNWLVAASVALLGIGEATLRVQGLLRKANGGPETFELARLEANAGGFDSGTDWTAAFEVDRGRFRVALLCDAERAATSLAALSQRIQQVVPGAEVVSLKVSLAESDGANLAAELEESMPDVVLAVLSACSEWAPVQPKRSVFDRERFALTRVVFGSSVTEDAPAAEVARDYESFLNELGSELATCRTPLDEAMRERWQRTFAALDEAVETCRAAEVPLALVVVPGELQLNQGLRTTLLRRCGMTPEQVDVELPQRRLAGFAQQREVPLVDLLPHLRLCRQAVYKRHQTELSDRGNIVAASAIGGWLESRYSDQMAEQLSRNK